MSNIKKLMMTAGGAGALNVEDVFSTDLWTGNKQPLTVTNNIDLDTEGGLVWAKSRSQNDDHRLIDTVAGGDKILCSNNNDDQKTETGIITFNTDGYDVGINAYINTDFVSGRTYTGWTFRKAPKFFDVVTYTGNGTAGRTVSHNLGTDVGFMVIKQTSASGEHWICYHRSLGASNPIYLNLTSAASGSTALPFNHTAPTSTEFTLGNWTAVNGNGASYVAYLFAHNNGDGEFGVTGDQDIIKCGSYTGNGSDQDIDLGFEPQWLLIKCTDNTTNWAILDIMRGISAETDAVFDPYIYANTAGAESKDYKTVKVNSNGFGLRGTGQPVNDNGNEYVYIAIRREQGTVPEDAADVFDIYQNESTATVPAFKHPFPVDFAFYKAASNVEDWWLSARPIQEMRYRFNEQTNLSPSSAYAFDYMDGWFTSSTTQTDYYSWAWKRAPQFFDIVTYDGTSSAQNVSHNLGVAPKLMMIRMLDQNAPFAVYWEPAGNTNNYFTHATGVTDNSPLWNNTSPTDSVFTVNGPYGDVNFNGFFYMALLFGEVDGVSKIGSYVGNGTSQNIDCGFSSGARFVLIKGSTSGDWIVFDTERGIVSGNDPYLRLNRNYAQNTSYDLIDAYSNGFTVNVSTSTIVNASGTTYYFYAIA